MNVNTKSEITMVAKWIILNGVTTHGPLWAAELIMTADAMREKSKDAPEHIRELILQYADQYDTVGAIEAITAGGAIDALKQMLEDSQ